MKHLVAIVGSCSFLAVGCSASVENVAGAEELGASSAALSSNPVGYLDHASGSYGGIQMGGWACDPDDYFSPIEVHLYLNGPAGIGQYLTKLPASQPRGPAVAANCGGNESHGFEYTYTCPTSNPAYDRGTIYAYAINIGSGENVPLTNLSAKFSFWCD